MITVKVVHLSWHSVNRLVTQYINILVGGGQDMVAHLMLCDLLP